MIDHPQGVRLCIIKSWANFKGFGFVLKTEKTNNQKIIDFVESYSPSKFAGILKDDIILTVNDKPVSMFIV